METDESFPNNRTYLVREFQYSRLGRDLGRRKCNMDLLWDENRPETCLSVGLDCRSCVQRSASSVAAVCPGLGDAGAQQVFYSIFPSSGCAPMSAAFAMAYVEAQAPARKSSGLAIVAAA
jgi:hypothetical protein